MPAIANLVHQQSASTGTGNFTLAAVNGKQSFDTAFGHGATTDVFDYFISNRDASEWERGTGHMSDATTLVRDTVLESTNSNAAVSFSAGTKDVMNDVPAAKQVRNEGSAPADGDFAVFDGISGGKIKGAGVGRKGPTVQVFNSSGTWTKPAGCVKIIATIIGGGGGGGGVNLASGQFCGGGGGGAGGIAISIIDVTSISSLSVTIGAAGAGGDGTVTGGFGGTGGTSQLGTSGANGQATGGSGGNGRSNAQGSSQLNAGGAGGDSSNCTINGTGEPGGTGFSFLLTNGQISGPGGSSLYGGGGVPVRPSGSSAVHNGADCAGFGGGGSGAAVTNSTTNTLGGAGGSGIVIIEEYYA